MHTFTPTDTDSKKIGLAFHHNSDMSGDVIIATRNHEVRVPGAAMLEFVAEYVRTHRISALEQATTEKLLGLES